MRNLMAGLLVIALLAGAACTKVETTATGAGNPWTEHGHLRFASLGNPDSLNVELGNTQLDVDLSMFWAGYLFNWSDKDEFVPELATEVPTLENGGISKDEQTITYKLRRGVKWQDGAPFNADDVIFSWHAIMNPKNNLSSRVGYDVISTIDKVDNFTVRVHLKRRWSPFVNSFFTMSGTAYPLLPAHILAKYPDINRVPYNDKPIGTGPFKIVEWKRGSYVHFEANPGYWRGPPKLKRVDYLVIPDENTIATQLKTHEIDLFYDASTGIYPQVRNIPGTRVYQTPFTQYSQIMFNVARPILRDKLVRQALAYGTNREAIIKDLAHGVPIKGDTDQPPFSWAYNPKVRAYPFDPVKARAMLEADGWKLGADGVRRKNGRRLRLEAANVAGSASGEALSVYLQATWHDIGVDLVLKNYSSALFFANSAAGGIVQTGKFDIAYLSWVNGIDPDDSTEFMCDQFPPNGQNTYRYCNHELDRQEQIALTHADRATRKKAYDAIQAILAEDVPLIIEYYARRTDVANTDLKNYKPAHVATMFWNTWELDI